MERQLHPGMVVRHFKRQWVDPASTKYLYRILAIAKHTETEEPLVVYEALYPPFAICARPYEMFMGLTDTEKYPDAVQEYRFEAVTEEQ